VCVCVCVGAMKANYKELWGEQWSEVGEQTPRPPNRFCSVDEEV